MRSLLLIIAFAFSTAATAQLAYPATKKIDQVDTYFGTQVPDPYRWLENDTTKETGDWVKSQNDVTAAYLKNIAYRDAVKKRIQPGAAGRVKFPAPSRLRSAPRAGRRPAP